MLTGVRAGRVGVCSWSLRPRDAAELAAKVRALGLSHVQLALDPIREAKPGWGEIETVHALRSAGITAVSGMMGTVGEDYSSLESIKVTGGVRVSKHWGENLRAAQENARLARRLGIGLITFHAGFIPHEGGKERRVMTDRLRAIVDRCDDCGVRVGFETGQETASTLMEAMEELKRPQAGVNFDPANMILYGMGDPVEALEGLAARVVQVHIKDAKPALKRGEWGEEVRAGTGAVAWERFFGVIRARGLAADLLIEREAGEERDADIRAAKDLLVKHGFSG